LKAMPEFKYYLSKAVSDCRSPQSKCQHGAPFASNELTGELFRTKFPLGVTFIRLKKDGKWLGKHQKSSKCR